jgi:hypothetical protein
MLVHFEVIDYDQFDKSVQITVGEKEVCISVGNHIHIEETEMSTMSFEDARRCLSAALVLINKRIKENG